MIDKIEVFILDNLTSPTFVTDLQKFLKSNFTEEVKDELVLGDEDITKSVNKLISMLNIPNEDRTLLTDLGKLSNHFKCVDDPLDYLCALTEEVKYVDEDEYVQWVDDNNLAYLLGGYPGKQDFINYMGPSLDEMSGMYSDKEFDTVVKYMSAQSHPLAYNQLMSGDFGIKNIARRGWAAIKRAIAKTNKASNNAAAKSMDSSAKDKLNSLQSGITNLGELLSLGQLTDLSSALTLGSLTEGLATIDCPNLDIQGRILRNYSSVDEAARDNALNKIETGELQSDLIDEEKTNISKYEVSKGMRQDKNPNVDVQDRIADRSFSSRDLLINSIARDFATARPISDFEDRVEKARKAYEKAQKDLGKKKSNVTQADVDAAKTAFDKATKSLKNRQKRDQDRLDKEELERLRSQSTGGGSGGSSKDADAYSVYDEKTQEELDQIDPKTLPTKDLALYMKAQNTQAEFRKSNETKPSVDDEFTKMTTQQFEEVDTSDMDENRYAAYVASKNRRNELFEQTLDKKSLYEHKKVSGWSPSAIRHNKALKKEIFSPDRKGAGGASGSGSGVVDTARSELNNFLGTSTGKMVAGGLVGAAGMGILGGLMKGTAGLLGGGGRRGYFSAQDLDSAVAIHAISRDMSKDDDDDPDSFSWVPALSAAGLLGGALLMNRVVVHGVNQGKLRDLEFERALKSGTLEPWNRDKDKTKDRDKNRDATADAIARLYYFSTQEVNPHALNVESTQNAPSTSVSTPAPTVNIVEPATTSEVKENTEFSRYEDMDNVDKLKYDISKTHRNKAVKDTVENVVSGVIGTAGKVVGAGVSGAMAIAQKGQESGKAIIRPDGSAGDANIPSAKSNTSDRR